MRYLSITGLIDVIKTVNMAQALSAKTDEGAEDEFEAAREREKSAESVLDRSG